MPQILKDSFLVIVTSSDESWLSLLRIEGGKKKNPYGYNVVEVKTTYLELWVLVATIF